MTSARERTVQSPAPAVTPATRRRSRTAVAVGAVLVVAVALRFLTRSELWLDESLSLGIARLPLDEGYQALRRDGSPPLYYLVLHGWIELFGTSEPAVRALSGLVSVATLPVVWLAARRLGGPQVAWTATLLVAVSPFAVRYATETRMYALLQLLAALGVLLVLRALESPALRRLAPVSLVAGLLSLTHYWALFLLAATGLLLLGLALRGPDRPAARRVLLALVAGGVLFVPWLPTFVFQATRTGTPWATPPGLYDVWSTLGTWSGGSTVPAALTLLVLLALAGLALLGRRAPGGVALAGPADRVSLALLALSLGTLVLGLVAGMLVGAGYAVRYSSVALVPALLLAARGVLALPDRARTALVAACVVGGLAGSLPQSLDDRRTQAGVTAAAITPGPGDVVVYCPDQLGPAVSRLLPAGTDQVVYPTLGPPALVDWVDYAQRNEAASPREVARQVDARATGAVWLVMEEGYRTFDEDCELLDSQLALLRGGSREVSESSGAYAERSRVVRYPARTTDGATAG